MFKASVFLCLQALLIQGFSAQCYGPYYGYAVEDLSWNAANALAWESGMGWAGPNPLGLESIALGATPCAASAMYAAAGPYSGPLPTPASLSASNGGGFAVSSASPVAPTGVSMTSENAYEGPLAVSGAIPFLGAVALEGALPTGGAGVVSYGSGNGNVAMLNEDYAGIGYGAGLAGPGYGYNGLAGPLAMEAGIVGPAYGYNGLAGPFEAALAGPAYAAGARFGCGCSAVY